MKFSIRTLLVAVAVFALASVVVVNLLPQSPTLPRCIGSRLSADEIAELLERYQVQELVSRSKSSLYTNAGRTCEIEIFDQRVVNVDLTLPLDRSLNIRIPKNANGLVDGLEYSKSTVFGHNCISIAPQASVMREIYGKISYTVTSDQSTNE